MCTLEDLQEGFTFTYDAVVWRITEIYRTSWDDSSHTVEYKLKSKGFKIRYLEVEYFEDSVRYSFWIKQNNSSFLKSVKASSDVVRLGRSDYPKGISYNGISYTFDNKFRIIRYQGV